MGRKITKEALTDFGKWLRQTRTIRGITQDDLAAESGTTSASMSLLESGQRVPSPDMVRRLAKALAPEHANPLSVRRLIDSGLVAAGFAPTEGTLEIMPALQSNIPKDERTALYEALERMTPEQRKAILMLAGDAPVQEVLPSPTVRPSRMDSPTTEAERRAGVAPYTKDDY